MGNYTVLGVSAGGGVSLYPFKEELIGNIELRPIFKTPFNVQWQLNFGSVPLITKGQKNFLKYHEPDVIISSPDCGSGSVLRFSRSKKLGNHLENNSLMLFLEYTPWYKPKFFYFENLEGLFKSFSEEDFDEILKNYRLIKHNAPVSMWGNSQVNRKRLVIIGIRKDLPKELDKYFKLPDYRHKNMSCIELYGDLDIPENDFRGIALGNVRELSDEYVTIYAGKKMYNYEITNYWQNELQGKRRWEVTDRKFSTAPGVYRNRKNDYPATARKANRQFDHRGLMLTPRQLARIQGVPDEFQIVVYKDKLNYWINKGRALVTKTPPMEISTWFKKKLDKTKNLDLW